MNYQNTWYCWTQFLPNVIHTTYSTGEKVLAIGSPKVDINPSNELQLNGLPGTEQLSAMRYKPRESRESQISCHTFIMDDDSKRLAQCWREAAHISKKYSAYRTEFMDLLIKLQSIWGGNLGRIIVLKNRIKPPDESIERVHLAPYCAGPKSREFDKLKIEKMLS